MTNREWMHALNDKDLIEFLIVDLEKIKSCSNNTRDYLQTWLISEHNDELGGNLLRLTGKNGPTLQLNDRLINTNAKNVTLYELVDDAMTTVYQGDIDSIPNNFLNSLYIGELTKDDDEHLELIIIFGDQYV